MQMENVPEKKAAVEPLTEGTIGHAADRLLADATLLYALRWGEKKVEI